MLSRSILLSLVAAAGVAAAAPASAADLNGYSYKPYKSGSPYDDPRYADPYGDEEPRYDTRRYRGSYKDDPVPYVEREPLPPSPPVPRNRYGYLEPMPAPPPPPVYVEPRYRRHAEPACAPRQVVMDRLRSEGWHDFHGVELREDAVIVEARQHNGRVFRLKVDRCTGEVLRARPVDHIAGGYGPGGYGPGGYGPGGYGYRPPPRDYRY